MFRVFYSWASDFSEKTNRLLIIKALQEALEELCNEPDIRLSSSDIEIVECRRFGGPTDIVEFIMTKLPRCQAHVADVSFVCKSKGPQGGKPRWMPNPNNMLEVGVALASPSIGVKRTILVLNKAHGDASELPFDIRNLNCLTYDASEDQGASSSPLKRQLKDSLKEIVISYQVMVTKVAHDFQESLSQFRPFFREFMSAYLNDEKFVDASMALFEPHAEMEPDEEALQFLLQAFHADKLAKPKQQGGAGETAGGRSWAYEFGLLLRRFQIDCQRIVFRYTHLQQSELLEAIRRTGKEAEFLESLCERIDSRISVEMLNRIFGEELNEFLRQLIDAGRKVAAVGEQGVGRCLST